MYATVGSYALAAAFDARTRRVPNILWVVLFVYLLWSGVTLDGVLAALGLAAIGWYGWRTGELGGADVMGMALLPLAFPRTWPIAVAVAFAGAGAVVYTTGSDDVPLFVPALVGVVCAALTSAVA